MSLAASHDVHCAECEAIIAEAIARAEEAERQRDEAKRWLEIKAADWHRVSWEWVGWQQKAEAERERLKRRLEEAERQRNAYKNGWEQELADKIRLVSKVERKLETLEAALTGASDLLGRCVDHTDLDWNVVQDISQWFLETVDARAALSHPEEAKEAEDAKQDERV